MSRLLYILAKTWLGGILVHLTFAYFSFAIPGKPLVETDSLLAFHHPSPSYPTHILIVPKGKYRSLIDLPSEEQIFINDLFRVVKSLVIDLDMESKGYRLVVNGGHAQEVNHLHFHLISEVS